MSHVTITGTIAGPVKPFTFADSGKTKTELRVLDGNLHHTVITWSDRSDLAEGDAVLCEDGRIGYRSYEKDNVKVWVTEVTCQRITKLGSVAAPIAAAPSGDDDDLGF
jgi:streptomycin 6-kinase